MSTSHVQWHQNNCVLSYTDLNGLPSIDLTPLLNVTILSGQDAAGNVSV